MSMEFFRQEHWSGLPFPTPGDLPDPEIKSTSFMSPVLAGRFLSEVPFSLYPYQQLSLVFFFVDSHSDILTDSHSVIAILICIFL